MFTYYKSLVNFRGRGDPAAILKCINPSEAKLIDSAAGVFIKFRLIGVYRFETNCNLVTKKPLENL